MLLDYGDFVVHVFSESARKFYDLERLWKTATRLELADLEKPEPKKPAVKKRRRQKDTPRNQRQRRPPAVGHEEFGKARFHPGKRTRKGK